MDLAFIRMITDDLEGVAQFYEEVTGVSRALSARLRRARHAVFHPRAWPHADDRPVRGRLSPPRRQSQRHHRFKVDDVDGDTTAQAAGRRLGSGAHHDAVGQPLILFRDPDGNLVNFFTPVTDDAIKKFGG